MSYSDNCSRVQCMSCKINRWNLCGVFSGFIRHSDIPFLYKPQSHKAKHRVHFLSHTHTSDISAIFGFCIMPKDTSICKVDELRIESPSWWTKHFFSSPEPKPLLIEKLKCSFSSRNWSWVFFLALPNGAVFYQWAQFTPVQSINPEFYSKYTCVCFCMGQSN